MLRSIFSQQRISLDHGIVLARLFNIVSLKLGRPISQTVLLPVLLRDATSLPLHSLGICHLRRNCDSAYISVVR